MNFLSWYLSEGAHKPLCAKVGSEGLLSAMLWSVRGGFFLILNDTNDMFV